MSTDSYTGDDIHELGQILVQSGKFHPDLWREFHCLCCRSVWGFLTNEVKAAVIQAERFSSNHLSAAELTATNAGMSAASNSAWEVVRAKKETIAGSDAMWPLSDDVDDAWCAYLNAECGRVTTEADLTASTTPESAASLIAWATARKQVSSAAGASFKRAKVESTWQRIHDAEEKKQARILRDLVVRKK